MLLRCIVPLTGKEYTNERRRVALKTTTYAFPVCHRAHVLSREGLEDMNGSAFVGKPSPFWKAAAVVDGDIEQLSSDQYLGGWVRSARVYATQCWLK